MDELTLAFGACSHLLRPLDFSLPGGEYRGRNGRLPKLVKIRHGCSPMCHCALRVPFGHALKCLLSRAISEGVQQSYASVELLLLGQPRKKSETILFPVSQARYGCVLLEPLRREGRATARLVFATDRTSHSSAVQQFPLVTSQSPLCPPWTPWSRTSCPSLERFPSSTFTRQRSKRRACRPLITPQIPYVLVDPWSRTFLSRC